MKPCFILMLGLLSGGHTLNASAEIDWRQHRIGWHWYQSRIISPKAQPTPTLNATSSPSLSPSQILQRLRQRLKIALDRAIVYPTPQHIAAYLTLQNQLNAQAHRFAQVWQTTLLHYPELNYSLRHPTHPLAKEALGEQQRPLEDQQLRTMAGRYGLMFFYHSTCPYCQRFAPIVKRLGERYGMSVLAITTDQTDLPEFPDSRRDQGQAAKLGITVEPALLAFDTQTQQFIPVGFGLLSEEELRTRLLSISRVNAPSGGSSFVTEI